MNYNIKTCAQCKKELPWSKFRLYRCIELADTCRACRDIEEKMQKEPETKICNICKKELPLNNYYKSVFNKGNLQSHCKDCDYDKNKLYIQRKLEEKKAIEQQAREKEENKAIEQEAREVPISIPLMYREMNGRPRRNQVQQWWGNY